MTVCIRAGIGWIDQIIQHNTDLPFSGARIEDPLTAHRSDVI